MLRKNFEIEKLRALAIIFVVLWHSTGLFLDVLGVNRNYYATWTGVDLFFCISGYVIAKSLIHSLEIPDLGAYLGGFYVKRLFRITPSAVICIAAALALSYLTQRVTGREFFVDTRDDALPALLNYSNFAYLFKARNHGGTLLGIFWSLSLEEQFYIVIPFLVWKFQRRLRILVAILLPVALWESALLREPWGSVLWAARSDGLIYGVVIALAQTSWPMFFQKVANGLRSIRKLADFLLVPILVSGLAVVAAPIAGAFTARSTGWAAVIGAALVFVASLECNVIFGDGLVSRALVWIGSRSFSMYLYHNFVFVVFKGLNQGVLHVTTKVTNPAYYLLLVSTVLALCALTELNYRIVEVPLRIVGRKLAERLFESPREGGPESVARVSGAMLP